MNINKDICNELNLNLELRLEDKFGDYRKQFIDLSKLSNQSFTIKKVINIAKNIFEKVNENDGYISYESFICNDINQNDIKNMHTNTNTIIILTRSDGNFYINDIEIKEGYVLSFNYDNITIKYKGHGVYNYIILSVS